MLDFETYKLMTGVDLVLLSKQYEHTFGKSIKPEIPKAFVTLYNMYY